MNLALIFMLCLLGADAAMMVGGRRKMNLDDPQIMLQINNLTSYGIERIAQARMDAKKNTISSEGGNSVVPVLKYAANVLVRSFAIKNYVLTFNKVKFGKSIHIL